MTVGGGLGEGERKTTKRRSRREGGEDKSNSDPSFLA